MTQNPHDALFRYTFSQPEHAAGLLKSVLPESLITRMDWSLLTLEPGSFVDEQLSARHTDLLFRVRIDDAEAFLFLLVEHQSTADPLMPLRMLRYVMRVWDRVAPDGRALPLVLPIVVFHGERPWGAPLEVRELIRTADLPEIEPYLPTLRFMLVDLSTQPDVALRSKAFTHLGLLTVLGLRTLPLSADPLDSLQRLLDLAARVVEAPRGIDALTAVLRYVLAVTDVDRHAIASLIATKLDKQTTEAVMTTTAERLIEEGRVTGETTGRVAVLAKLLTLKFGTLTAEHVAQLQHASIEDLDLYADRILTATSIGEVLVANG